VAHTATQSRLRGLIEEVCNGAVTEAIKESPCSLIAHPSQLLRQAQRRRVGRYCTAVVTVACYDVRAAHAVGNVRHRRQLPAVPPAFINLIV